MAAGWLVLALAGCSGQMSPVPRSGVDQQFFGPATMKLNPVFSKVADFDGDNLPDGIEAVVELQDTFGDPTKAAGRVVFTIYQFHPYSPDNRGPRLAGPFEGRVDSLADQSARWSRVNRAYIFQLALTGARLDRDYVVEAMFETTDGRRLFDRLFIEGDHQKAPTSGPAPIITTQPSTQSATQPAPPPTTQESTRAPSTSQPHEPPPRADQP